MYQEPLEIDRLCDRCQGLLKCITPSYFKTKKFKCISCNRVTAYEARLVCLNCTNGIMVQFAKGELQFAKESEKEFYYQCDLCQERKIFNIEV